MFTLAFDTETTGTVTDKDRIVEFGAVLYEDGNVVDRYQVRINPGFPMPKAAEAVHGISDADLKDAPLFAAEAPRIRELLEKVNVLLGYNVGFDVNMIHSEFNRLGIDLQLHKKPVLDPLKLWNAMEPRTLAGAYRRFVGGELEGAHGALTDAEAAAKVMAGMIKAFGLEGKTVDEIVLIQDPDIAARVFPGHTILLWNEEGRAKFSAYGKHKNELLYDVLREDPQYIVWLTLKNPGPKYTALPELIRNAFEAARHLDEATWSAKMKGSTLLK